MIVARSLQQYPQEEEFPVVTFPGLRDYVKPHGHSDPADAKLRLPLNGPSPKDRPPKNIRIMGAIDRTQKKSVVCSICKLMVITHEAAGSAVPEDVQQLCNLSTLYAFTR
eukprot:gb/GECG01010103.1/.p1 GENE.gb/GECG01010103.1/~~gb/GECG01010103.1/.p1  ORF type:complete len:110 (+),score=7.03 gb/GECG01010103.1/:1-330(+)